MTSRFDAVNPAIRENKKPNLPVTQVSMEMLINFDRNSLDIKPQYLKELAKVASFLRDNHSVNATIKSQAINLLATPLRAQEISHSRAQQVVNYLVDVEAIPRSRLTAEGFNQVDRFVYHPTDNQQENFRLNIILDYKK